jgi:long-chain acyl-CoA synthetase
VRSKSAAVDEDSVKADAIANAPAYQHPRRVIFIDEMPLAGTNKVDKRALASWIPSGPKT